MRIFLCVLLFLAAAIGGAFYFGLCTIVGEREEKNYVLRLVIQPDFLVPKQDGASAGENLGEFSLEAKGRIASVDPAKSQFALTENFKNLTFRVGSDTTVAINDQPAKLADLKGGDEATVVYTKQGQILNASAVRCTRKPRVE